MACYSTDEGCKHNRIMLLTFYLENVTVLEWCECPWLNQSCPLNIFPIKVAILDKKLSLRIFKFSRFVKETPDKGQKIFDIDIE